MNLRRTSILAVVAVTVGCAQAAPPAQTNGPSTAPEVPRTPASGPDYYVVPSDNVVPAVASRRAALMAAGQRLGADEVGYYLDVQEARFRQVAAAGVIVTRVEERVILSLPGTLGFDVGSATLTRDATAALRGLARVLVDYTLSVVAVHGHTDSSGDSASNQRLSEQRAVAVARQLIASGVSAERIVIAGFGASVPLGSNASVEGRELNRRVELYVTPLGP